MSLRRHFIPKAFLFRRPPRHTKFTPAVAETLLARTESLTGVVLGSYCIGTRSKENFLTTCVYLFEQDS